MTMALPAVRWPRVSLLPAAIGMLALCSCANAAARRGPVSLLPRSRDDWNPPLRLTGGPAGAYNADYCPRTGALAYVSDRDGGADVFLCERPLDPAAPTRRLTTHGAQDRFPRISPDGRLVAFVTTRHDTSGDVWLCRLGRWPWGRRLRRLTEPGRADDQPCWHPDGRRLFFASAPDPRGPYGLSEVRAAGGPALPVRADAQMPDCSPDGRFIVFVRPRPARDADGTPAADLWVRRLADRQEAQLTSGPEIDVQPCWSSDGGTVFFVRYALDTNGDGRVDLHDTSSVFSLAFQERAFVGAGPAPVRQLTSLETSETDPRPFGKGFLFTRAAALGRVDVYALGPCGEAPDLDDVDEFLQFARSTEQTEAGVHRRLLAWSGVAWAAQSHGGASAPDGLAEARLRIGRCYAEMGLERDAARVWREIVMEAPGSPVQAGLARVDLLALGRSGIDPGDDSAWRDHLAAAAGLEQEFAELARSADEAHREALLEVAALAREATGRAHVARSQYGDAVAAFEAVLSEYPGQEDACARVLLGIADVFTALGEADGVSRTCERLLRDVGRRSPHAAEAARRLVDGAVQPDAPLEDRLSALRRLAELHGDLPIVPALVQNALGDAFHAAGDEQEALAQYRRTVAAYPGEAEQAAAACLAQARIHMDRQDYSSAAGVLQELLARYGDRPGPVTDRAESWLGRSLLRKAEVERDLGDPGTAMATYETLAGSAPGSVAARRGIVECYALLGRAADAVERYRAELTADPRDHLAAYALALAYSYYGPSDWAGGSGPTRRRAMIDREAMRVLNTAIVLCWDVPYYHQLKGFLLSRLALTTGDQGCGAAALDAQLTALGLSDREADPANHAALLFNVGDAYTFVERPEAGFEYYRQALRAGFPLAGARGTTAVRNISRSAVAAGRYDFAADLLEQATTAALGSEVTTAGLRRRAELLDLLALAYDLGERPDAAVAARRRYLAAVDGLVRQDPSSAADYRRNLLRGYRNLAISLYKSAASGAAPIQTLSEAFDLLREAVVEMEKVGVIERDDRAAAGLFTVDVDVALGGAGSVRFDADAERRLLYAYMARISALAGDHRAAAEYTERRLGLYADLAPRPDQVDLLTEAAIVWTQLGGYRLADGDPLAASRAYSRALALESRAGNLEGELSAAVSLGRAVIALAGTRRGREASQAVARAVSVHQDLVDRLRSLPDARLAVAEAALVGDLTRLTALASVLEDEG
jgi:tetratricopeptide (TPR) repeat protein